MAEILLSLTIIGVVAAITLPSLTGNINERTWNTQRKALYARFSQAMALMPSLNGYGTLIQGDESISAVDTATETFITEGLSKVMKINNICDFEHLTDCGLPSKITPLNYGNNSASTVNLSEITTLSGYNSLMTNHSESYIQIDTKAAAFETQNGESILVYYNPHCTADLKGETVHYSQPNMCANFVYDLNGSKGPNTVGKDIGFITALYPSDPIIVAPIPSNAVVSAKQFEANTNCHAKDNESRVPSKEELSSMFYNVKLVGKAPKGQHFWYGTAVPSSKNGMYIMLSSGIRYPHPSSSTLDVWCVKR